MEEVLVEEGLRDRLRSLSIARASQFSWAKTGQETVEVLKEYL